MNLPPLKHALAPNETDILPSVEVLVRISGLDDLFIGRYFYGLKEWDTDFDHANPPVIEWWPLPLAGTGEKVG